MKTSELLRKAADEIRRRGWTQGEFGSSSRNFMDCSVCPLGALNAAGSKTGDPWGLDGCQPWKVSDAKVALAHAISPEGQFTAIISWNDEPGRTKKEVLEAFERAAVKEEAAGD